MIALTLTTLNIRGRPAALHKHRNAWWEHGWPFTYLMRDLWKSHPDGIACSRWFLWDGGNTSFAADLLVANVAVSAAIVLVVVCGFEIVLRRRRKGTGTFFGRPACADDSAERAEK